MCFGIAQVYLRSATCRVYKGHLLNEWVIKPFRKHPKSNKFFSIKSSLQCIHNSYTFCRNSKISQNSSYRFLINFTQQKTIIQRICGGKHFKRKCRTGLKFDSQLKPLWRHCHVTIHVSPCVMCHNGFTIKTDLFKYKRFKDGGCAY